MTVVRFDIVLNKREESVYRPGESVTGSVFVHNSSDLSFDDFYIELKGYAKVAWSDGDHHGLPYSAEEEYVDTRHHFVQHIVGCRCELSAGEHQYPFILRLPKDIPSSYLGVHGKVDYILRTIIKRSWHEHDQLSEVHITVCSDLDLNKLPEARVPRKTSQSKDHMLFKPGNIFAILFIDKTGYAPGETIYVSARIENNCNSSVDSSMIQLVQRETSIAPSNRRVTERVVLQVKKGKIPHSETMIWNREPMVVPSLPPSGLPHCNIIDISYEIKLVVNPGPFTSNLVDSLKILIGTIPYYKRQISDDEPGKVEDKNSNVSAV